VGAAVSFGYFVRVVSVSEAFENRQSAAARSALAFGCAAGPSAVRRNKFRGGWRGSVVSGKSWIPWTDGIILPGSNRRPVLTDQRRYAGGGIVRAA